MGYYQSSIYEIIPLDTYRIVRSCAGCGCLRIYRCTEKVRMNANGKRMDIWLIYQCETCKHTYNLPLYTRVSSKDLERNFYEALQRNDPQVVSGFMTDRAFLQRQGAKISGEPPFKLRHVEDLQEENTWRFLNPCHMRIRYDKLMADCMGISRSHVQKMLDNQTLTVDKLSGETFVVRYTAD